MSEQQDSDSFDEKQAVRTYNILTGVLVGLVFCAAALNFTIHVKQGTLTKTAAGAQAQSMVSQRMALLISQFETAPDSLQLDDLKESARAAIINHDTMEPELLSVLPEQLNDGTSAQDSVAAVRRFVNQTMIYASAPHAIGAKEAGDGLVNQSHDVAALWDILTTDFIAAAQKQIDILMYISFGTYLLMLCLLGYEGWAVVRPALVHIGRQKADLNRVAAMDTLSGVYNRAMLFKVAGMLISTYKRQARSLSALAVDIDFLKKINDTYGRAAGDALIKKVAATLGEVLRTSDVTGRVGGGEFCIFLPSIEERRAAMVAEKLRAAIEAMSFIVKNNALTVSVSIGVAEMTDQHKTPDDMLRAAEEALRRAKDAGHNFVFSFSMIEDAIVKGTAV